VFFKNGWADELMSAISLSESLNGDFMISQDGDHQYLRNRSTFQVCKIFGVDFVKLFILAHHEAYLKW